LDDFVRATDLPEVVGYSCLATHPRFDGSPRDVAELSGLTPKPILFKDFVLGPRQLDVAVSVGASAVLLIARLATAGLLEQPLPDLTRAAHERGLEVLLELYGPAEVSIGAEVPADMYGVNARDLDTLTLDRSHAERTIEEAWERGLSPLLGLSGIERPVDARRYFDSGADGVVVGTALARAPDPAGFLKSLLEPPAEARR
jgi:indole-3-glycerol phosphate synthase